MASIRQERLSELANSLLVLQFALPNGLYTKTECPHGSHLLGISLAIGANLGDPPFRVRLRQLSKLAATVAVPETTMDEDGPTSSLVCDIWAPRQILWTSTKA